jgi:hypothetical protein
MAASILRQHAFPALFNVAGGTNAWIASGFETQ